MYVFTVHKFNEFLKLFSREGISQIKHKLLTALKGLSAIYSAHKVFRQPNSLIPNTPHTKTNPPIDIVTVYV